MIVLRSVLALVLFLFVMSLQTWIRVRFAQPIWGKALAHVAFTSSSILLLALITYGCFRGQEQPSLQEKLKSVFPWLVSFGASWAYLIRRLDGSNPPVSFAFEALVIGLATMSLAVIFLLYAALSMNVLSRVLECARSKNLADVRISQATMAAHSLLNVFGVFLLLASPRSPLSADFGLYYFFVAPPLVAITLYMAKKRIVFESRLALAIALISTILLIPGWCVALFGVDRLLYPLPTE